MVNYWEYLRFDKYEDVFVEDEHYLYVQCEPFNWAHSLACREYTAHGKGFYPSSDWSGATCEYLETLEKAPLKIARAIIEQEHREAEAFAEYLESLEEMEEN